MPKKQEAHPNLNEGGNENNAYGAGRPRNVLRNRLLAGAEKSTKYWLEVANGNKVVLVPGIGNKPDTTRKPTHEERGKAFETLLRYGLGTKDEIVMLGNADVLDQVAEILAEKIEDADLVDQILVALGARLNGEGQ